MASCATKGYLEPAAVALSSSRFALSLSAPCRASSSGSLGVLASSKKSVQNLRNALTLRSSKVFCRATTVCGCLCVLRSALATSERFRTLPSSVSVILADPTRKAINTSIEGRSHP